jgi:hypothetical protein
MWKFDEYELRLTGPQDAALAEEWTKADPEHSGRFPSTFWLEKNPSTDGMILEDGQGPVLFLRVERFARIHIQFPPASGARERMRVMKAMESGMRWIIPRLGVLGFCGLIFASRVQKLREFTKKRFGFMDVQSDLFLYKDIPVYTPPNYRHLGEPLGQDEKVQ